MIIIKMIIGRVIIKTPRGVNMDKRSLKVVIAPDSFKESLSSTEVSNVIEIGIKRGLPSAKCVKIPMGDGGEGTMKALIDAIGGNIYDVMVTGPLGNRVKASYGISLDGEIGVLEMASASGIDLVPIDLRNPMITTTYGTGEVIKEVLNHGVKKIIIGIGGSATNDCGAGMLQALGVSISNSAEVEIDYGGGALDKAVKIDINGLDSRIQDVEIQVACDVDNPLTGETGASRIYGPQKGADSKQVDILDYNLKHFAMLIEKELHIKVDDIPGAGAAGGLGAALHGFLNGKLMRGIDIVIKAVKLEEHIKDADLVITGEGKIDSSTLYGKTVAGVTNISKKYDVPVIALTGAIGDDAQKLYDMGVSSMFSITQHPCSLKEAYRDAAENLQRTSENISRMIDKLLC